MSIYLIRHTEVDVPKGTCYGQKDVPLKKNAEKLKIATTETARQSERGIVDMDTLKATNESLISTLDEVMAIQREGREKRQAAEAELRNMEQELKGKLLQLHG